MKHLFLSLAGLLTIFMFSACGDDSGKGKGTGGTDSTGGGPKIAGALDTGKVAFGERKGNTLAFVVMSQCDVEKMNQFCIKGLPYMAFGEPLVWTELEVEGAVVKDTVYLNPGDPDGDWNVKEVRYPDGKVILESDWEDMKDLARIRIETPQLKNVHGIGVGSTLQDIADKYTILLIEPYPEEGILEVYISETNPVVIFHVDAPEGMNLETDEVKIAELPADLKVNRVLLWDKTVGNSGA